MTFKEFVKLKEVGTSTADVAVFTRQPSPAVPPKPGEWKKWKKKKKDKKKD